MRPPATSSVVATAAQILRLTPSHWHHLDMAVKARGRRREPAIWRLCLENQKVIWLPDAVIYDAAPAANARVLPHEPG